MLFIADSTIYYLPMINEIFVYIWQTETSAIPALHHSAVKARTAAPKRLYYIPLKNETKQNASPPPPPPPRKQQNICVCVCVCVRACVRACEDNGYNSAIFVMSSFLSFVRCNLLAWFRGHPSEICGRQYDISGRKICLVYSLFSGIFLGFPQVNVHCIHKIKTW